MSEKSAHAVPKARGSRVKEAMTLRCLLAKGLVPLAALLFSVLVPQPARAEAPQILPTTPKPYAYGVFVGHNQGGPGQGTLRYAELDARAAAQTLREVGHYGESDMRVLTAPSPAEVLSALDVLAARLREHAKRGEQAVLIFYYSGHAKANALDLGDKELELAALRDKLKSMPTTLTLVVLDACQSGAFTRTKGVEAAKDFSTNSVARLTQRGIAVMASSTAQEMSQESDELRSSYFTHHFLVGLRGAGDADRDGKVTLDEAYRYAYRRTLAATARTAVGGQHVTLETDLSGQGEVPLAFPSAAKSRLELPAPLSGRVLVLHKASGSIVAEIQKPAGVATVLALPAGEYEATVREGDSVHTCAVTLADDKSTPLDVATCAATGATARAKGDGDDEGVAGGAPAAEPIANAPPPAPAQPAEKPAEPHGELRNWALELGLGQTFLAQDAYVNRLNAFGYTRQDTTLWRFSGTITRNLGRYVALGVHGEILPSFKYNRHFTGADDDVSVTAFSGGGLLRFILPFTAEGARTWGEAYVQGSGGLAHSSLSVQTASSHDQTDSSYSLGGAFGAAMGGRFGGGFIQLGYDYAPALTNNIGDTHNVGGTYVLLGGRFRTY